jgi:arabinofuranan 3-O-arabinosyltransferase
VGSGPPAQLHITASSTFGSLPALRPQNLLESGGGNGWVAAGPNATLHLQWQGQRTIGEIDLVASTVGIAAEPTRVVITSPDGARDVPVPQSGVLHFPPLITDQLDISFPGVMPTTAYNPLVGQAQQLPVGLARLSVPALAGLSTGLPAPGAPFRLGCGQGPPVTVDGHTHPTSVSGTVSDLTDLTPLPLHLCTKGAALTLSAGRHWLTSPGTGVPLAVTDLSLRAATASPATAPSGASRQLRIGLWGAEYRTATIGPGRQSYLEVHDVANPGWTATLNGHRLTPVTLDGWQQAFIVPAGGGGQVIMTFTPVTGYRWLLAGSVLAICVLIAAAAWPSRRRPRLRPLPADAGLVGPAPAQISPSLGPLGYWLAVAAAAAVLALVGGPLVAAVPVLLVLGWRRPRWVPWLALAAMCVAGALALTSLTHGPQTGTGAFGWPAQAAALVALAAALTPTARGTQRRTSTGALGDEGHAG